LNPAYSGNGKLRPFCAIVDGKPEIHPEGVYALRYLKGGVRVYHTVGNDPQVAATTKLRVEHSLIGMTLGVPRLVDEAPLAPTLDVERSPTPVPQNVPRSAEGASPDAPKSELEKSIAQYLTETKLLKSKSTHHIPAWEE